MIKKEKPSAQIDMLHGSMMKKILLFAMPLAASSILQQLFNAADAAVVGRFAGSESLAAVGATSSAINLLINIFVGLSVGANVVIANYVGQGKKEKIHDAVHTSLGIALVSGLFLLAAGMLAAGPLLKLMNTPDNVLGLAVLYLRLYFIGMPFMMVYNFGSAVLRCVGDTKKPLYCLILSGFINVGLNLVFVILMGMGVAGVAIATVISNGISAAMILWFLTHSESEIRLSLKKICIRKPELVKIMKIGLPAGLQSLVFSISNVCIQSAVNSFGSSAVAGSAAALNYECIVYFVAAAFSQAAVTFTSQNFGAGKYERCKRVYGLCLISCAVITAAMSTVFIIGRESLSSFFTTDATALQYSMERIVHVELLEFLLGVYEVTAGCMRGMMHSLLPAILTIIGTCVLRIVWIFTVFQWHRDFGVLLNSYPVSWILTCIMVFIAYRMICRKEFVGDGTNGMAGIETCDR